MEKKVIKKILALLMIITILSADFMILGSSLISYAASQLETATDEPNITFAAYFKNEKNEKVNNISQSIKSQDLKLYAEIQVQKEGYLKDGIIEVQNTNFNVKNDILSPEILKIEGNKIKLKQINAGETVEIEIGIEPIITNKVPANMEFGETVKLTGKYVSSENEEGEEITPVNRNVSVNYKAEEPAIPELEKEVITKKVYTVNEATETMVQLLVRSRLSENQYPVKETKIEVSVPEINGKTPKVKVIAANGRTEIKDYISKDGKVTITLSNEPDAQNQVKWYRNGYDEIIVTYIYEGTVDASNASLTVSAEIELYNAENEIKPKAGNVSKIIFHEKDNRIIANQEINTVEMYKGQLYANTEMEYTTTTTLVVPDINEEKEVVIKEGTDKFILEDRTTLDTDSKYVKTEIDKKQLIDILGNEGTITIKSGDTTLLDTTKVSQVNEEKITVNYTNPERELEIITSDPKAEGIVEIQHTKTMTSNGYTREQIRKIKEIETAGIIQGKTSETEPITAKAEMKETISKAELSIENRKVNLSTIEPNEIILGVTLNTDDAKYDLFKNPVITIQLPSDVENVEFLAEPSKINANAFEKIIKEYDSINKIIKLTLEGEQEKYAESSATQAYIQLNLKVTLSQLATSHDDLITMTYKNENATNYYNEGKDEQKISISAPSKVITKFDLSSNENNSLTEPLLQKVDKNDKGKSLDFKIVLVNNEDSDINNVQILGKLPTTANVVPGEDENTLETVLKSINAPDATVYYTENVNAANDIEDETNGWTTNLSSLTNAKLYLIKIDNLEKGNTYTATATITLPNTLTENSVSYSQYEVIYDTQTEKTVRELSRKIGLMTSAVATIQTNINAQVGQEILKNGDIVKEGEVVRYTAIVKNNSNKTFENIQLKANVPEGTVVVEPVELYQYSVNPFYYEEKTDIKEISITIPTLASEEIYTKQYEVRVNMNATTERTEISNEIIVTSNETQIKSEKITNSLKAADVRVTIRREDDQSATLVAGGNANYRVLVENFSNKEMNDIKIQLVSNEFVVTKIEKNTNVGGVLVYAKSEMEVGQIPKQGNMCFIVNGNIVDDVEKLNINAKVTYSNEMYISNTITEALPNIKTEIALTSPQNNQNIKQGENVTYNITVKNTGDTIKGRIMIKDIIPECLEIESIFVNGNVYIQKTNKEDKETYVDSIMNEVEYYTNSETKTGDVIQITINAKVKEIPISADGSVIVNKAEVFAYEVYEGTSEEVKHILDCGQKNVVAGLVWLDDDSDGIKDDKESTLSGIIVKLYDISTKSFLKDTNGNIVKTQTGANGEYQFTQIPNGSYIIVFEHGMENYEPTASQADFKAKLHEIIVNGEKITVSGIEIINMQNVIISSANMGLKYKEIQNPDNSNPDQPNDPTQPENPDQPNNPTEPENPNESDKPTEIDKTKEISGYAWLDSDRDGEMDQNENVLEGIKVKLYDISTQNYLKDEKGNVAKTSTDKYGKYKFSKIKEGLYIIIFEYDTEEYEPTTYLAEGIDGAKNSKVVLKKININGEEKVTAVTDTINLKEDISDINIGLREKLVFDLELSKSISRIVVQNNNGTKAYDYENKDFAKVEIHRKQINGSLVVLEYTIKVKNTGESVGYAKNIVDYLPSGLTFSSELNKDWYLSGNYLYTKALENVELKPGEEKEVKLVLTKAMTNNNVGLINNRAEIYQDYNEYGIADIDSKPNNQIQDEDDLGSADVIILVATGGGPIISYMMLLITNIILIGMAIKLMIRNKIIKIPNKRGRR